jgi:prevent-host-death family protein
MIGEITNFRDFRTKLKHYIDMAINGQNIIVSSKNRKVVLLSLEEYQELTGDETEYLLSTEANKNHLLEGINQVGQGQTEKFSMDELID